MAVSKTKKRDPMLTKNGKKNIFPLNEKQLTDMLESARKKYKPVIARRIAILQSRKKSAELV